ncbi:MAG: ATP-binding protein [Acidobacteria bacterium]|nr:ATP-binding protein [Acidobacteriota bacterium]
MIARPRYRAEAEARLKSNPVVALLGPRQTGKTTLARQISRNRQSHYLDLEDPTIEARLAEPKRALEPLKGLVVLDEIQRRPELFSLLRVLADRKPLPARFLILGSASPGLVRGVSESLAGRVSFIDVHGFDLEEVGSKALQKLWWRGGFPPAFLATTDERCRQWQQDLLRTLLERDLPQLGITTPAATLRRFWTMIAHFHGQLWNAAELARSLGASEPTARRYLDTLTSMFLVRQLQPWFENLGKRQVKAPKIYVRDSGLLHALLGVDSFHDLQGHPKLGASWEGFALEHVLHLFAGTEAYFWATYSGAELDLFLPWRGKRWGFEFKNTSAPVMTKSMRVALEDLKLNGIFVIHSGADAYPLDERVEALPLTQMYTRLQRLSPTRVRKTGTKGSRQK